VPAEKFKTALASQTHTVAPGPNKILYIVDEICSRSIASARRARQVEKPASNKRGVFHCGS